MNQNAPYHAHIYYTAATRDLAADLGDRLRGTGEPGTPTLAFVGELRDHPVGPHPEPQFEIHFLKAALPVVLPILIASGLRVLVHPLTDDDLADHTTLGTWIGEPLALDLTTLDPPGANQGIPRFGKTDF
jgi:DOPA 4,5-dioxygenase